MEILSPKLIFLCIAAFVAGFINSIAGGGGLITLPALMIANIPAHTVLGTNKLQAASGSLFATINYAIRGKIIWKIAFLGIPFTLIGSVSGTKLALYFSTTMLTKILIILLPPATVLMFFSNTLIKRQKAEHIVSKSTLLIIPAVCFVLGAYDGFFGPGTGTFLIVFLVLFSKLPLLNASATAKTFNLTSNIGALCTFIISGNVNFIIGIPMAVSNILGSVTGSSLAIKRGDRLVQKFVYLAIIVLFVYLIWSYYN